MGDDWNPDVAVESTAPKITLSDRVLRVVENNVILTLLGIAGGLVGAFLNGRYFVVLAPILPLVMHRTKALEGLEPPTPALVYCFSPIVAVVLLLLGGNSLNHARGGVLTPADYASLVKTYAALAKAIPSGSVRAFQVIYTPQQTGAGAPLGAIPTPTPTSQDDLLVDAEKELDVCHGFLQRSDFRKHTLPNPAEGLGETNERLKECGAYANPKNCVTQRTNEIHAIEGKFSSREIELWEVTYGAEFNTTYTRMLEANSGKYNLPIPYNSNSNGAPSSIEGHRSQCKVLKYMLDQRDPNQIRSPSPARTSR
jgi:hypothetical protein